MPLKTFASARRKRSFELVGDDQHVEPAVVELGVGEQHHAAAVAARVADGDGEASALVALAVDA